MQIQLNHVTYQESDVVDDEDSNMIGGKKKRHDAVFVCSGMPTEHVHIHACTPAAVS